MIPCQLIKHRTERLPGICRNEIYEWENMTYTIVIDDVTNARISGRVTMRGNTMECNVLPNGTVTLSMVDSLPMERKHMLTLISDLKKLDEFVASVCEEYK